MGTKLWTGIIAGTCGLTFVGYCIYFDRKRRSDPDFKRKLKERRAKWKQAAAADNKSKLPNMRDQEAVQKYFMDEIQIGEDLLAKGDFEGCVEHLTNGIVVCGQPQQLLQVFQGTLPPPVFEMLVKSVSKLNASSMAASVDSEGLD